MEEGRELIKKAIATLTSEINYGLVRVLMEAGPTTAGELTEKMGRARSTIDEHVKELMEVGLIVRRKVNQKYVFEATRLARACVGFMEGKGSMEELYKLIPQEAELKVKVREGSGLTMIFSSLVKAPAFIGLSLGLFFILLSPIAPWLDVRVLVMLVCLLGLANWRGGCGCRKEGFVNLLSNCSFSYGYSSCV